MLVEIRCILSRSIPRVVVRCVDYLRERAMHVSGIFQINVAKTDIMNAWKHLEAHGRLFCDDIFLLCCNNDILRNAHRLCDPYTRHKMAMYRVQMTRTFLESTILM